MASEYDPELCIHTLTPNGIIWQIIISISLINPGETELTISKDLVKSHFHSSGFLFQKPIPT